MKRRGFVLFVGGTADQITGVAELETDREGGVVSFTPDITLIPRAEHLLRVALRVALEMTAAEHLGN